MDWNQEVFSFFDMNADAIVVVFPLGRKKLDPHGFRKSRTEPTRGLVTLSREKRGGRRNDVHSHRVPGLVEKPLQADRR